MLSINKLDLNSKSAKQQATSGDAGPQNDTPVAADEQRTAYYEQSRNDLLLYFAAFDSTVIRAQFAIDSNKLERERYAKEKIELKNTIQTVRENNTVLHEELREAQKLLETRKGYDKLTEKISANGALKPRNEQQADIDKLNAEIAELEAESQEFVKTRAERGEQFGRIVAECKHLLGLIHGDREEVERQDAMDGASSRDGTPAGGSTPAHAPTVAEVQSPSHGSKLKESAMAVEPVVEKGDDDKAKLEEDAEMQDDAAATEEKPDPETEVALPDDVGAHKEGGNTPAAADTFSRQPDGAGVGVAGPPKPDTMDET